MNAPTVDLDALLTVEQFAAWRQVKPSTVRRQLPTLPGVVRESRKDIRIHPRTYLDARVQRGFRR